jgi:hypothetical protein
MARKTPGTSIAGIVNLLGAIFFAGFTLVVTPIYSERRGPGMGAVMGITGAILSLVLLVIGIRALRWAWSDDNDGDDK